MKEWSQVNQKLSKEDKEKLFKSVVTDYSEMKVEEYVNFGKTFKPYMQFESNAVDAMSPANQSVCEQPANQAAAADCLNNWMLGGFKDS
jgi:hypothetical protein